MATTIRTASTDADYESWRAVRLAVMPYERCPSVAELRGVDRPGRLMVLAEIDAQVVGSGVADRSGDGQRASLTAFVRPDFRRRGVGTDLLRVLAGHAVDLGYDTAGTFVDDEGSRRFAEGFGFAEINREVEQVRRIGAEPWPAPPTGYQIVSVAERPELWAAAYHQVALPTLPDMDHPSALQVSAAEWQKEWINDPAAMFVAVVGTDVIGVAGLKLDSDRPERAEVGYTAVRREWRGRSVAATLKRTSMAWAAEHGITEIYTWTQRGNEAMRRLNEHLGFRYGIVSSTMRAPLPLAVEPPGTR
ncbi:GNAT family N-acetyltransferase [Actinocatenispora thailandica]|uniref:GNAT family N-acetyltransferase n=1 Tax=Actinocatenispora thailandica TaxID=227318 RepID=A0A7R7DSQ8_9ACTN|nr:GNAT family N-acetyltransferase [Actinocatenispora thailandica]BCJ37107.1 GNAT family N-acetyltransferase [Actinocatenispora thailandica]